MTQLSEELDLPEGDDAGQLAQSDSGSTDIESAPTAGAVDRADSSASRGTGRRISLPSRTVLLCLIIFSLSGLVGWLGFHAFQAHRIEQRQALFLQTARQGALNLTTIAHTSADADVQRILDGATGGFYDEFAQRSSSFVEAVRAAKSTSVGTIIDAGIESDGTNDAQVLVAVRVQTTVADTPEQPPRNWRMRIEVQRSGESTKVSKVAFIP